MQDNDNSVEPAKMISGYSQFKFVDGENNYKFDMLSGKDMLHTQEFNADNSTIYSDRLQAIKNLARTFATEDVYEVPEGMPRSVWEDKYSRRKPDGTFQSWSERLREVVVGNFSLDTGLNYSMDEFRDTLDLSLKGVMPFSGRHLQNGDENQIKKNMELFCNCSTAIFCFTNFWLLLNGSGVGSDYSCYTRRINFARNMPHVRFVLNGGSDDDGNVAKGAHADFSAAYNEFRGGFESTREAQHKYPANSEDVRWFTVEDSAEGWVKIVEIIETAAWQEKHADKLFIFDFSQVRGAGQPIVGKQNRPASGPLPLMRALAKIVNMKGVPNMAPWKQAMFIDHYLAACVALGGVRRAARMATKWWKDPDIFDFIEIKRGGFLWSANISILVDKEFWRDVEDPRSHAWRVFQAATAAQYYDHTGDPGFINVDMMNENRSGSQLITPDTYINPNSKLKLHPRTRDMMAKILGYITAMPHPFIVNPCGEIVLAIWGAYCVVADVCLAYAKTKEQALRAVELMPRCLIRTNTMNALYDAEVKRTNRIGTSLTGIHEFAMNLWKINFRDMVNVFRQVSLSGVYTRTAKKIEAAKDFWNFIATMRDASMKSADEYSDLMGLNRPHTYNTIKPSGTISKVMNCTEGAHLPSVKYYMRWVQFPLTIADKPNPVVAELVANGYPVKDISHMYHNYCVIGYPTKQPIVDLMKDEVLTASEVTPEEQFEWLRLIEEFWFGTAADGTPMNNQVSYTMKYRPEDLTYQQYMQMLRTGMPTVRCCAIMPIEDVSAYVYQPEEELTEEQYIAARANIKVFQDHESYDDDALNCAGGVCAVDVSINVPQLTA